MTSQPHPTSFDCTDVQAVLSSLVDGEADALTRHAAERHMVQCADCRERITKAERVSSMLGFDAASLAGTDSVAGTLPVDFMNAVLGETVFLTRRRRTQWLINSTGWLAAAACLTLALVLWNTERTRSSTGLEKSVAIGPTPALPFESSSVGYRKSLVSEISNEPLSPDMFGLSVNTHTDITPSTSSLTALIAQPMLAREDAETLAAAGFALELLDSADLSTFSDVERIRRTAEYDSLLSRLADTRSRLASVDRPAVLAAEGLLLRITRGPLDLADLRELRTIASDLDLAQSLRALGERWQPNQSL